MNIDELKNVIEKLYCKEGRSITYIAKLFNLNRAELNKKISEWEFIRSGKIYLKPSIVKYLNKNKNVISNSLKDMELISNICKKINISKPELISYINSDSFLRELYIEYNSKLTSIDNRINDSKFNYCFENISDEIWKEITGYPNYFVSNYGRVKHYSVRNKSFYLLKPILNKVNNRLYISLYNDNKHSYLQLSRLVGFAFVSGYSSEKNTINHKDGNTKNNKAENLEWVSQAENNLHAFKVLRRTKATRQKSNKSYIYNNNYRFKTVAALARFLNKSETQVRRYLEHPEKYNIQIIEK